jgi:hypothetical protein
LPKAAAPQIPAREKGDIVLSVHQTIPNFVKDLQLSFYIFKSAYVHLKHEFVSFSIILRNWPSGNVIKKGLKLEQKTAFSGFCFVVFRATVRSH